MRELAAEQDTRVRSASDAEAAHARTLLETYRQRESDVRQALERSQPLERLIAHFRADFEDRREVSFAERARDAGAAALLWARRVWQFEIPTLEDSLQTAEGRTITVERSVTVGKSVGAVLVVVLGYWPGVITRNVPDTYTFGGTYAWTVADGQSLEARVDLVNLNAKHDLYHLAQVRRRWRRNHAMGGSRQRSLQ